MRNADRLGYGAPFTFYARTPQVSATTQSTKSPALWKIVDGRSVTYLCSLDPIANATYGIFTQARASPSLLYRVLFTHGPQNSRKHAEPAPSVDTHATTRPPRPRGYRALRIPESAGSAVVFGPWEGMARTCSKRRVPQIVMPRAHPEVAGAMTRAVMPIGMKEARPARDEHQC